MRKKISIRRSHTTPHHDSALWIETFLPLRFPKGSKGVRPIRLPQNFKTEPSIKGGVPCDVPECRQGHASMTASVRPAENRLN
jgi:hypothetical protein